MNIFVSNLNFKVGSDGLKALFEQYGKVDSAKVLTDKMYGESRGFGFVEMSDSDGQRAVDALSGTVDHEGRAIAVNIAGPIAITEEAALELALDEVESMYDPYMELVHDDEWVCILLDGTVVLAGEYQAMYVEDYEDAEMILFKFHLGELVEQYFEFKRKSNLSKP